MKETVEISVNQEIRKKIRRKWYYTVFITLAAIVVFCTVYALILPAVTMSKEQKVLECQLNIHQHTEKCYDEEEKLICGQADFVIHTHDEDCLDADGNTVCKLPEIKEHEHTEECYDKDGEITCTLPEIEEHKHSDSCYNDNGELICGKLQTDEHKHGAACFKKAEETKKTETRDDTAQTNSVSSEAEAEISTASENTARSSETYGYNPDGSIYWTEDTVTDIKINEIQENTPYIISGYAGNNLMGKETYTKQGSSYLKAIPKGDAGDYSLYQRWYFEKIAANGNYYLYYLDKNEDGSTTPLYLRFAGSGVAEWGNPTQQLVLTDDKTQATAFAVEKCTDARFPNHIAVSAAVGADTFYINSYFGDKPASNGNTTHWLGYKEYSEGSFLKIRQYHPSQEHTAQRTDTVNTPNTVLNIFDYWTKGQDLSDAGEDALFEGINKDHNLKFYKYSGNYEKFLTDYGTMNILQSQGVINSNMVKNKLVDGYPMLSGDAAVTGGSTESLSYLFNPRQTGVAGREAYTNVGGLLRINDQGYYYFDSRENMAEYNKDENAVFLYDKPGVQVGGSGDTSVFGQFFPLNQAPQIMTSTSTDPVMNHYLGLTLTTRFIQQHGGYSDPTEKNATQFSFSGDDDVWIFIDNVLVADLGGAHASCGVTIDFSTGNITTIYTDNKGQPKESTKTLYDMYSAAGATDITSWNGKTYADNSTHTLKFFYLERGNWDSNLRLKYNLAEIPETIIHKVDQKNRPVKDAVFAVYAADNDYNMLSEKNGEKVNITNPKYDANGNILDESGKIAVHALYYGKTNSNGELRFTDQDNMPYSLSELKDLFGSKFILREIQAPEGFRIVSKTIKLEIWQGATQLILRCNNVSESGSRAAPTLQITATDTLYLQRAYNGSSSIQYCDENGNTFGTLFAVLMKYTGGVDSDGNATELGAETSWSPLYGNDNDGYKIVNTGNSILENSIEAAKQDANYNENVFSISSGGTMQLKLRNMPGNIYTYYRMLGAENKLKTKYTVAYYWTDQDSLDKANTDNTYRVYTYPDQVDASLNYKGFQRIFGANIHVPNLSNKLYVQKMDKNNRRINGAAFALYKVQQQEDGTIRYLASDGSYVLPDKDFAPDTESGAFTCEGKTVNPLMTGLTRDYGDNIHTGTTEFDNMTEGQYIVKEIKAPPGYTINKENVMVLVTGDTIYANAGTEDDGITIGRGPGYLSRSISQMASEGQVDNTLSWIYAQMQISKPSTSFADIGNKDMIAGYLTKNNTGLTSKDEKDAARSYLEYSPASDEGSFNYVQDPERSLENGDQNPTGTRRLFTTVGWPYYEIYQDYEYGKTAKDKNANYSDWSNQDLSNLYSRSTYIRVTDTQETSLNVKKTDSTNKDVLLSGAQFRLYCKDEDGTKLYYTRDNEGNVSWNADVSGAMVVTTGSDGMSDKTFTKLSDGTYYLEEIKPPDGYYLPTSPIELTITMANMSLGSSSAGSTVSESKDSLNEETNLYTYTVTVPNNTGYELPSSGGIGTILFTAGGILLISVSLVCLYRNKRKCERRVE